MTRIFKLLAVLQGLAFTLAAIAPASLAAQVQSKELDSALEVSLTYNSTLANVTTTRTFWMQGGALQVNGRVWRDLGIAGDVVALHTGNVNNSGVGLDLISYTAGPRYTWRPSHGNATYFGEALAGVAHGANSIFPTGGHIDSSSNSVALQLGGGINLLVSRHLMVRAVEADWLRTQFPNATTDVQNNLLLGTGIAYRF